MFGTRAANFCREIGEVGSEVHSRNAGKLDFGSVGKEIEVLFRCLYFEMVDTYIHYALTGQLSMFGVPLSLKVLHARPIEPMVPSKSDSRTHSDDWMSIDLGAFGSKNGSGASSSLHLLFSSSSSSSLSLKYERRDNRRGVKK